MNDDLENVETKDKNKLKMIWRTISFLVGIFFTIVVIYFLYRFFTGLANATIRGVSSLFAYTKHLADDLVTALVNGFVTFVTFPFKLVDDFVNFIFG